MFCDLTFTALDFVQNRSIYIGKVKGFWSISVNWCRKSQRIFCQHRSIYIGKVRGFWSISVDLYRKSHRNVTNISRFKHQKWKDCSQHWWIYNYISFVKISRDQPIFMIWRHLGSYSRHLKRILDTWKKKRF